MTVTLHDSTHERRTHRRTASLTSIVSILRLHTMDSPPEAKKRASPAVSRGNSAKFFRCFKPAVIEDVDDGRGDKEERGPGEEPSFGYVAGKENDGSDDREKKKKKKKRSLKLFSRASKAVFFEKSLAKKIQNGKGTKNSLESMSSLSTEADRILRLMHQNSGDRFSDNDSVRETESNDSTSSHSSVVASTSPSLSSSRSSSTNSSLRGRTRPSTGSSSFNSKQIQLGAVEDSKERPSSSENSAICLLLLTLLVLVLWGKVCAIVCTSTWLLFVPRWSIVKRPRSSSESGDDSSDVDSAEYKKKIILQGLLQRKRSPGVLPF